MCATVYRWHHLVKATEVTTGLVENNGSPLPDGWLNPYVAIGGVFYPLDVLFILLL